MKNLKFLAFLFSMILLVWSCEEKMEDPVNPLTANAGEEQEVNVGATVVLDGSNSSNSLGKPMTYSWTLLEKPNGANPTISPTNQVAIQFSTATDGEYKFELEVSYQSWKDKDEVIITVAEGVELTLEANAGEDKAAELGSTVLLDGSQSLNETGSDHSYSWEFIQKPVGSTVQIPAPTEELTGFVPDLSGEYLIKLTIKAGTKQSSDLLKITVTEGIGSGEGPIIIHADILSDYTLTDVFVDDPEKLDYLVTKDIAVSNAKLTIEPGVRIGFEEGTGLVIDATGSLKAYSLDVMNKPIVFQGKEPLKGYWDGINIYSTQPVEYMNGLEIRDAGKLGFGIKVNDGSKIQLNATKVHHNLGVGVWFDLTSDLDEFKYNELYDNEVAPLKIPARLLSKVFIENEILDQNIQVTEGKILSGSEDFWPRFDVQYDVLTDLIIYNHSTLLLSHGTRLNIADDKSIRVINGSILKILGSETAPVIIEGMTKQKGAWRGIYIDNSQSRPSTLIYAEIKHAGSNPTAGQTPATIKLGDGAALQLSRSKLDLGKGDGFEAVGNNIKLEFTQNSIKNHLGHPISVTADLVEHLDYMTIMENNVFNEVAVDGYRALSKDVTEIYWEGFASKTPYVVKGLGKDLTIQSGMRLKAGVIIKMQPGSRIDIQNANGRLGYLSVDGVPGNPVIIQGTVETNGSWFGITYSTNHQQNLISNALIKHAGKTLDSNFSSAITVDNVPQGSLLIQNTTISFSGQHGISVVQGFQDFLRVSNLSFEEIPGEHIYVWN